MKPKLSDLTKMRLAILVHIPFLVIGGLVMKSVNDMLPFPYNWLAVGSMVIVFATILSISIVYWMNKIAPL